MTSDDELALYEAILDCRLPPQLDSYADGRAAHAAGKHFYEGPRPIMSVRAVSWRIGWNDRALETE